MKKVAKKNVNQTEPDPLDIMVTAKQLAELFNLTPGRVSQLTKAKLFIGEKPAGVGKGREVHYPLRQSIQAYLGNLRTGGEKDTLEVDEEYKRLRNEEKEKKNRKLDLDYDITRGKYLSRESVLEEGARLGALLVGLFDAMRSDLPGQVAGLPEREVQKQLGNRFDSALRELNSRLEEV